MKRLVIGLVVAIAVIAGVAPQTVHAASEVKVSGVVLDQGVPVAGIKVQVECWETGFTERPVTDANGLYYVTTDTLNCPLGTTLKVRSNTALNAKVGFKFGTVQLVNQLNIDLIDTHGIPEFGWVGGVLAAGAGTGLIIFTRRRYAPSASGNGKVL